MKPNIIELSDNTEEPLFGLILGVEIFAKIHVVLDFGPKSIVIDYILNPMQQYEAFKDTKKLYQITK